MQSDHKPCPDTKIREQTSWNKTNLRHCTAAFKSYIFSFHLRAWFCHPNSSSRCVHLGEGFFSFFFFFLFSPQTLFFHRFFSPKKNKKKFHHFFFVVRTNQFCFGMDDNTCRWKERGILFAVLTKTLMFFLERPQSGIKPVWPLFCLSNPNHQLSLLI